MRVSKAAVRTAIPWAMASGRAALGPVLAVGAKCQWNGLALAGIVLAALVSDIFDGVLARRWGCDTAAVRLFDTLADTFFYGWTAVALWWFAPEVWREHAGLLVAVLMLETLHFGFDFMKFGRPASYHSYLAKSWGLVLASAVLGVFALGRSNGLVPVALWLGIVCKLEGLAMSVMLREWQRDVKTLAVAWRLRGQQAVHAPSPDSGRLAGLWRRA